MMIGQQFAIDLIGAVFGTRIGSLILNQRFIHKHEMQKDQSAREFRNHEREVDILDKLLPKLSEVQCFFQRMTACIGVMPEDRERYRSRSSEAASKAYEQFTNGHLWISPEIIDLCNRFFIRCRVGLWKFDCANHIPLGSEGALSKQYWEDAEGIAIEDLPELLQDIEASARKVVHGGAAQAQHNLRSCVRACIPAIAYDAFNRGRGMLLRLWRYIWQIWRRVLHW